MAGAVGSTVEDGGAPPTSASSSAGAAATCASSSAPELPAPAVAASAPSEDPLTVSTTSPPPTSSSPRGPGGEVAAPDMGSPETAALRHRQLASAVASLRMYNPDFHLTPEVLGIMRVFFEDLDPDRQGTISLRALFAEIARLDPQEELVSRETRELMWRDIGARAAENERIDFTAFCAFVMRWKEISPTSVQNVYTSWAKQLAVLDFGLSEGDGVFVVRAEELPRGDELRFQLKELLKWRRRRKSRSRRSDLMDGPEDELDLPPTGNGGSDHGTTSALETATSDTATEQITIFSPEMDDEEDGDFEREDGDSRGKNGEEATHRPKDSMMTVSKSFLAGGIAGMIAKSALAPVDRIKIMFQVHDKRVFSFRNAFNLAKEIYIQDGFKALFRGNMLNIIRVVPYAGVQHSSFDFFRRQFHTYNYKIAERLGPEAEKTGRDYNKLTNTQLVIAGSLAGGLSLTLSYPLDIVRARFMVQHGQHKYSSLLEAVKEMYRREGARSFSRGLLPSLMGTLPYTGVGFALNEKFKHWALEVQQRNAGAEDNVRLHPFSKLACSYFAACIAQTFTYPMDTIRRRIQTDGFVSGKGQHAELRYTGIVTTARIIITHEGWRGFFKGVSVNWMRSPLATSISLTAYDVLKEVMGVEKVG